MSATSFSISKSLKFASRTLFKRFWLLLSVQLMMTLALQQLAEFIPLISPWRLSEDVGSYCKSFACLVLSQIFMGGYVSILLNLVDGKNTCFTDLFQKNHLFCRFLTPAVCFWLAACLGLYLLVIPISFKLNPMIHIALGIIVIIVPGIITALRSGFYGLCIVDEQLKPIAAISRSWDLTGHCRWKLFGFGCLLTAITVPVFLLTCLGLGGVVASLHFEQQSFTAKTILGLLLICCLVPTSIFWELAWTHCYRQITTNADKALNNHHQENILPAQPVLARVGYPVREYSYSVEGAQDSTKFAAPTNWLDDKHTESINEVRPAPVLPQSIPLDKWDTHEESDSKTWDQIKPPSLIFLERITAIGGPVIGFMTVASWAAGIWLAFLGEWGAIGYGLLLSIFIDGPLGWAMLPGTLIGSALVGDGSNKGMSFVLGSIIAFGNKILVISLWLAGVFAGFLHLVHPTALIPTYIWCFGVSSAPFSSMASAERDNVQTTIYTFFIMLTSLILVAGFWWFKFDFVTALTVSIITLVFASVYQIRLFRQLEERRY